MTYLSTVLADNPLHYWRCADPGGNYLHDIGSTPVALQLGTPDGNPLNYTGPNSDGGAVWVGDGSALNYTDNDQTFATPFSLECWFWLHHLAGAAVGFLGVGNGTTQCSVGLDSTGHAHAFSSGGSASGAAVISKQHWHHIVLTSTAAASSLYLDGSSVATPTAASISTTAGFIVGADGNPISPLRFANASLSECAYYGTALSAARVSAHFAAADQPTARPVFQSSGVFTVSGGTLTTLAADLTAVLAAVRKTFPTT